MEIVGNNIIDIFTDGSCNPQFQIGAWASIIFINNEKIVIQGFENDTTHNRMELIAIIKSIEYVINKDSDSKLLKIHTDSQYVERIPLRSERLISNNFKTKKGIPIQNADLVKILIALLDSTSVEFIKVKAHQKVFDLPNYNREVDKLSRKLVREKVNDLN